MPGWPAPNAALRHSLDRWRRQPVDLRRFVTALCIGTVAGSLVDPAFNNYLRDTFSLGADQRGKLEFPRELPGFLVTFTSGLLFFLPEARTAAVATVVTALGVAGLAWAGSSYATMVACMFCWSLGMHLMMPMRSAITLSFARQGQQATILGVTGSITTVASILGSAAGWWLFARFGANAHSYNAAFLASAVLMMASAVLLLRLSTPTVGEARPRAKLVVRRRYWVYYVMSMLSGARKQVFITFAPWVLITIFHQGPSTFAALAIVASILGTGVQPLLGRLIDRFGERRLLVLEGLLLVLVCLGYGFGHRLGATEFVLPLICVCFVFDNLLFSFGMARTTYVTKIAERQEDLTATLSLGVTLDHAVSMSIPVLGGLTWMAYGFEYVFLGAAGLAILSAVVALQVRLPASTAATG